MANQLLEVKGLSVKVEDKEILHGINLEIKKGETHVLMGPNGAGKSTLGYALMGNPRYEVTQGEIRFQGCLLYTSHISRRRSWKKRQRKQALKQSSRHREA